MHAETVLALVEAHLRTHLGADSGRAVVDFVGAERVEVLRFGPDPRGLVRYVTLGLSRAPMSSETGYDVATTGPRAELLLTVGGLVDSVSRRLAVLASAPAAEGLVLAPGAGVDLQEPLWEGARFTAVLLGEPGADVPDLALPGEELPVRVLPLHPMTPNEAAWKRVHGGPALEERWLTSGLDLRDPGRSEVDLTV